MAQPKILQVVADMRADGMSDQEIIGNLRQLGLTDDQIKQIMKVADQDVYSKFKREMAGFVEERIKKNKDLIQEMVSGAVDQKMQGIKKEVVSDTEQVVGDFAKTVNQKTGDMALAVKKVRDENVQILEEQRLNRSDIDLLLSGPSKLRLAISVFFLLAGILIILYTVSVVTPQLVSFDFTDLERGLMLMVTGAMYIIFAMACFVVGIYFTGKPGRQ